MTMTNPPARSEAEPMTAYQEARERGATSYPAGLVTLPSRLMTATYDDDVRSPAMWPVTRCSLCTGEGAQGREIEIVRVSRERVAARHRPGHGCRTDEHAPATVWEEPPPALAEAVRGRRPSVADALIRMMRGTA